MKTDTDPRISGKTEPMPVLFIGHGSPMNAIENNRFTLGWREAADSLPKPKAILCISAHWKTWGTLVTAMEWPKTIHDVGGFPQELCEAQYPAPGSTWLAHEIKSSVKKVQVGLNEDWGLDHGCWSVLIRMFPEADVPVVQLSLDYTKTPQEHYDLAKELAPLRRKGVLIIGSGNMVHNLRTSDLNGNDLSNFNQPFGHDWAVEGSQHIKKLINDDNHQALIHYPELGPAIQLAVPTPEHYLPLLYVLALKEDHETITYFNDKLLAGSLSMTCVKIQLPACYAGQVGICGCLPRSIIPKIW
jgi:4,5-DOPA dioxygenase extradiol